MNARAMILALLLIAPLAAQDKPQDPAPATLSIQAASADETDAGKTAKLVGPEARLQVVVTGKLPDGTLRDFSGSAAYATAPEGIVTVDASGLVTPLKEGSATITATAGSAKASVPVAVEHFVDPPLINFP